MLSSERVLELILIKLIHSVMALESLYRDFEPNWYK
jgi:hypothetical protein